VDFADAPTMVKVLVMLCALSLPVVAAEQIALRPGYRVGDRYAIALVTKTDTRVDARGAASKSFREKVELRYTAQVEVLEVDAAGAPLRERHEGVDLTYERPEGRQSLFAQGAVFELTRRSGGSVEIRFGGERVQPQIERIVGDLLAHQSECTVAALLDPGRPVAVGERWELDPDRVREFLRARGIQSPKLSGPSTAKLETGDGDQLSLRYRIPIDQFALKDLPENSTRTDSEGSLQGELRLDGHGLHRAIAHTSALSLEIDGAVHPPGTTATAAWSLARSQSVDQHTETLRDQLATSR
jgi:hypothetical protein